MMRTITRICAALLLAAAASCQSPLDPDTPRIDIRILNAVKIQQMSASVQLPRGQDTTTISDWDFTITRRTFTLDTTKSPPVMGMDCILTSNTVPTDGSMQLKSFRLRFNNVPASGEAVLDSSAPVNGLVELVVTANGVEHQLKGGDNATGTFHYLNNGLQEIRGTFFVVTYGPMGNIIVAMNFRAGRDATTASP